MKLSVLQFVEPMEWLMVFKLPEGADWSYESSWMGYRAQALSDATGTQLISRNGKDLGKRFPAVVAALERAIPHGSIVDGELVALDERTESPASASFRTQHQRSYVRLLCP